MIREQGVTFAVVIVKKHVIDSSTEAGRAIAAFQPVFPGVPVVLMAQDCKGHTGLLRSPGHRPVPGGRAALGDPVEEVHGLTGRVDRNPG